MNGAPLTTQYHPYAFAAEDDLAVCYPRESYRTTTILFVQAMLKNERWRYSYYRKCYMHKLRRLVIYAPVKDGQIDEDQIERIVSSSPFWSFQIKRWGHPSGRNVLAVLGVA